MQGELKSRDRWAAGLLTDLLAKKPELKIIVLYGELHVSMLHLPHALETLMKRTLRRSAATLVIHQNNDELYWKVAKRLARSSQPEKLGHQHGIYSLKAGVVCVMSSTPWAKLQSLLDYLETNLQNEFPEEEEDEQITDYLSSLRSYGKNLGQLLELSLPTYEDLHLATIHEANFLDRLPPEAPDLKKSEERAMKFLISMNQRFFSRKLKLAYLGTPSLNGIVELAALHLYRREKPGDLDLFRSVDDFFHFSLERAFSFFCTLLINPRRKCDLEEDHRLRISLLKKGERSGFAHELKCRRLTLSLIRSSGKTPLWNQSLRDLRSRMSAASPLDLLMTAHFFGEFLGKKAHVLLIQGKKPLSALSHFFLEKELLASAEERCQTLLSERTNHIQKSKSETL